MKQGKQRSRGVRPRAHGPDGVHAEARDADVGGAQPDARGDDGADRRPARAVVAHDELLDGDARAPRDLAHDKARRGVCRVALVVVGLQHRAAVQLGLVVGLVLGGLCSSF